jgi:hypothetical protein
MRSTRDGLHAVLGACAVALIAGCAGAGSQSASALPAAGPTRDGSAVHRDRSWMLPAAKKAILIYAAVDDSATVDVYDYAGGQRVGSITGFGAAGGCVDAKGDVYIVSGDGSAFEYAHGGTQPINTYSPGGDLVGCSVNARGDLAITGSSPGQITVYAKGNPKNGATYSSSTCEIQSALGYDNAGNLIGAGKYDTVYFCALLKRAKEETTLSAGFTVKAPNGSMWDGKYLVIGDQEAGSGGQTGMYETTLSGRTLASAGEVLLADTCYRGYVDVVNPFVVGKVNTPITKEQGRVVVGSNQFCAENDSEGIQFWHYPQGGLPYKEYATPRPVTVLAVSIGS